MSRELKFLPLTEVRFAEGEAGTFTGYASVWDSPDSYGDVIRKGAFAKTLKRMRPAMLWAHDTSTPIGTWTDLVEDERGLKVAGKLVTETRMGSEALALLKAGAVSGLSIGFRAVRSERGPNGGRVLTEIELPEISVVVLPAATKARVESVRGRSTHPASMSAYLETVRRATSAIKGL